MNERNFKVKSIRYNQEVVVIAKNEQNALDKVAALDNNFYFTGILNKDVFVEEVSE